jgi:hypothetical protein
MVCQDEQALAKLIYSGTVAESSDK